jgi:phage terminase small subunit
MDATHSSEDVSELGELTPKQLAFIVLYPLKWNGTQAAIQAGYSAHTAPSIAQQLLRHPRIQKAIKEGQQARIDALGITKERILQELKSIAFSDKRRVAKWRPETTEIITSDKDGMVIKQHTSAHIEVTPSDELDDEDAAAITGISMSKYGPKIEFASKEQALQLLGKELGMFRDRVEHTADDSLAAIVAASFKPKEV